MHAALTAIWLSVVLGAALGIGQRFAPRVTEPIRTFAVVAALLVVSFSLLPHALACEGAGGLLGAGLGYGAIPLLERLGRAVFRRAELGSLRLELGYAGLLLHRFGDGVAMSVEGHGYGVLWALGAHEVPIVALVTLAFARRGLAAALARAFALGLSSSLGYALVSALPAATWHDLHGWGDAIAAGVLVHIVAHELPGALGRGGLGGHAQLPPEEVPPERARPLGQRALNLAAALIACALIGGLGLDHESGARDLLGPLLGLALQLAPWLCAGWVVQLALRSAALPPGLRALLGVADPRALALAWGASGWRFALAYAAAALALGGALLAARSAPPREPPAPAEPAAGKLDSRELLSSLGWVCLGLLAATYAARYVPQPAASGLSLEASLGFGSLVAALAYASAPAAVPLAAAFLGKGLPVGLALAGLLLGPQLRRLPLHGAGVHAHAAPERT